MATKSEENLLLTLRQLDIPRCALYAGLYILCAISSEILKAEWQKKCLKPSVKSEALFNGWWALRCDADYHAQTAREHGQLLFAHAGSTLLQGGAA